MSLSHPRLKMTALHTNFLGDRGKFYEYRGLFLLVLAALLLFLMKSFIKPMVMGAICAAVLMPYMERWRAPCLSRAWKSLVVTFVFAVSIMLPLGSLLVVGTSAGIKKVQAIQQQINLQEGQALSSQAVFEAFGIHGWIDKVAKWVPLSHEQLQDVVMKVFQGAGNFVTSMLQSIVADLPAVLISNIIVLATLYFLLLDGPRAVQFMRQNSFFSSRATDRLLSNMQAICYSTFAATLVAGLVQTLLIITACLITGTSNIALIALVSFIASFVPVIGTTPVSLFLIVQAFLNGEIGTVITFAIFAIIVGISDNFVRPLVLRGGAQMHPLVGFVAAFAALDAIGFFGLFIGPVVAGMFFQVLPLVTQAYRR